MLYAWPAVVDADRRDRPGSGPRASSRSRIDGFDRRDIADEAERRVARARPGSARRPRRDSPTASGAVHVDRRRRCRGSPCRRAPCGRCRRVSASVTRRPSRNSGTLPSRSMRSLICGPPPCTTTGRMPDRAHQHDVLGEQVSAGLGLPSVHALPPYLTTTVLPQNRRMYGQGLDQRRRLLPRARGHGYNPTVGKPVVSGKPSTRLAHCTAPARRALHEVVDRGDDHDPTRARIEARREVDAVLPERRLRRRRSRPHDDEGLAGVRAPATPRAAIRSSVWCRPLAARNKSPGCPGSSVRGAV